MADKGRWVHRITDGAQLFGESLPGVSILELAGDSRILIERHGGVLEYGRERISIRMNYGSLCIGGSGLELKHMTRQLLVVTGCIDHIKIQRRC